MHVLIPCTWRGTTRTGAHHKRQPLTHAEPRLVNTEFQANGGPIASMPLLEKQKEGKKKLRQFGKVDIPQEAFTAALKVDS